MTNTREEVAVAEALIKQCNVNCNAKSGSPSDSIIYTHFYLMAKAAIAASNSKYIPQLVAALKAMRNGTLTDACGDTVEMTKGDYKSIAQEALNNLPKEIRQ